MSPNNKYYVYGLIDSITDELFYVGKGCNSRCYEHQWKVSNGVVHGRKDNRIRRILDNGGNVVVRKLYEDLSENDAYTLEMNTIKHYGRKYIDEDGILLNVTLDGKPPGMVGKKHTADTKRRISERNRGQIPWNKGKIATDEMKQNMSAAQYKRFGNSSVSADTRLKMRERRIGRTMSDEFKQKMVESWNHRPRTLSDIHKQRIKDSWIRRKLAKNNEGCIE